MTIIAGILSRGASELNEGTVSELNGLLSRSDSVEIDTFRIDRLLLAKVDVGAYKQPASIFNDGSHVTGIVGKPLLDAGGNDRSLSRQQELERLHEALASGRFSLLRFCRGIFAAASYNQSTRTLTVLTDQLGIRPIYWWSNDEYFVFASALRILEGLSLVPKQMDVTGVTETTCFGYPLGRRTQYRGIRRLYAGELLTVSPSCLKSEYYWQWDAAPASTQPLAHTRRELYSCFRDAVRIRLGSDESAVAYLSGGLDSRCIVTQILDLQARVATFNFSRANTQDRGFARLFAEAAGADHHEIPTEHRANPNWSMLMAKAVARTEWRGRTAPAHPRLVWSGDGGSVAIGHVYMHRDVVKLLRAGQKEHAIATFLERQRAGVVQSVFRRKIRHKLARIPLDGIRSELPASHPLDPAREFHLFLLHNDQRRHLDRHFETIDLHRLEFQLPFFDTEVLRCILSAPLDECLHHHLYSDWLSEFPEIVRSTPWQTYPGHVPCPLPTIEDSTYQWGKRQSALYRATERKGLLRKAWRLLFSASLTALLSRTRLALATTAYQLRLRDCGYMLRVALTFQRYWESSDEQLVGGEARAEDLLRERST